MCQQIWRDHEERHLPVVRPSVLVERLREPIRVPVRVGPVRGEVVAVVIDADLKDPPSGSQAEVQAPIGLEHFRQRMRVTLANGGGTAKVLLGRATEPLGVVRVQGHRRTLGAVRPSVTALSRRPISSPQPSRAADTRAEASASRPRPCRPSPPAIPDED